MPTTTLKEPTLIAFGGTFDPPHIGHVGCVEQTLRRFPAARVCVLPAPLPPASAHQTKAVASSFEHRLAMAQLAFGDLGPRVRVLPLERDLPQPNYTVNTLQSLAKQFPDDRLGFLLGQDQWLALPKWRDPQTIVASADLIIVARTDTLSSPTTLIETSEATAQALSLKLRWHAGHTYADLGSSARRAYFIVDPVSSAASSAARRAYAGASPATSTVATLSEVAAWLAPAVTSYIEQHQLYKPSPKDTP